MVWEQNGVKVLKTKLVLVYMGLKENNRIIENIS
jgi:hypothetical protein